MVSYSMYFAAEVYHIEVEMIRIANLLQRNSTVCWRSVGTIPSGNFQIQQHGTTPQRPFQGWEFALRYFAQNRSN